MKLELWIHKGESYYKLAVPSDFKYLDFIWHFIEGLQIEYREVPSLPWPYTVQINLIKAGFLQKYKICSYSPFNLSRNLIRNILLLHHVRSINAHSHLIKVRLNHNWCPEDRWLKSSSVLLTFLAFKFILKIQKPTKSSHPKTFSCKKAK